jgi:hypothetical protein
MPDPVAAHAAGPFLPPPYAPGACDALADWAAPLTADIADLPRWQAWPAGC